MVKKHLIDKRTIEHLISPYKEMINEYKTYMVSNITDHKGNYDKLINIGKSLIVIKDYVQSSSFHKDYFSSLLISEINSCLYCIKNNLPKRYFYFSYRGVIETFARLNIIDNTSRIVDNVFNDFKEQNAIIIADNEFYNDFYSVIKSKYSTSSGYVHGSKELEFSIKEAIEDMQNPDFQKDIQEMIKELEIILELIKKFYLSKDNEYATLKHIFNRRTIVLKYLLSKAEIRIIF